MSRLPTPGSDAGNWGDVLNDFLTQAHRADGTLKDDSVGAAQLLDDAVGSAQLANNSVTAVQLATSSVQTTALADSSVTTPKLADASVTSAKLAPGVLAGVTVADGSITTAKLADDAVTNVKVDAATRVSLTKADSASQPGHTHAIADVTDLQTTLDGKQPSGSYVPTSRTVAGHDLTADVVITPADIGAATAAEGVLATTALQPGQITSLTKKVIGVSYFAVSSRSYPALIRPPEPGRGRLVIRNVGTNNVNVVVANRTIANYNSPGWTGAIVVTAGNELVADYCSSDLFIGPDADGTLIKVKVYAEVSA